MGLWSELMSDEVGLLSLITIVVATLVVAVCIVIFYRRAMNAPDPEQKSDEATPRTGV